VFFTALATRYKLFTHKNMTAEQEIKLLTFLLQRCALNPAELAGASEAVRVLEGATKPEHKP
jgi:hypothetical protein